jgi:hypothetical protein
MTTHVLSHTQQIHIPGAAYMRGHFICVAPITIELKDPDANERMLHASNLQPSKSLSPPK